MNWYSPRGSVPNHVQDAGHYYIQLTWAGGKGCGGDHSKDAESKTGVMCASVQDKGEDMISAPCNVKTESQLFRLEKLPYRGFQGRKNSQQEVGVYR